MADGLQVQHHRSVPWICGSGKGMVKRGKIRGNQGKIGTLRENYGTTWTHMGNILCISIYLYIYVSIYIYISICMYIYVYLYIYTSIYLCISMCISMYIDNII